MDNERIAIRGTVTRDPELNTTPKGKIYTRINVAADEVTIDGNKMDASENKYQSVLFWGIEAVDRVKEVKQGAQVAVTGQHVVRQAEGRDGQMRVFSEVHRGSLIVEKQPRERVKGVSVEIKGEVLYDPELKAVPGSTGKFYTVVTIRPENGGEKVRAAFFGDEALDLARLVRKGAQVLVRGEMVEREYKNRDGLPAKSLELQKADMRVLESGLSTGPKTTGVRQVDEGLGR
jgi:single-stranded DNA-binding protein